MSDTTAIITLDVCTPEGKTWLARVTGMGGQYGLERDFCRAISRDLSRSGRTGTMTYAVSDGLYEANEGRRRLGRTYWRVTGGVAAEITLDELRAEIER